MLHRVAEKFGHTLTVTEGLLGGVAIHKTGSPLPAETLRLALEADATLMGAVGLPEFDNAPPDKRPEKGLFGIRKALGVFANLRPVRSFKSLLDSSPLKNHLVDGTDLIIVRELTGGSTTAPPGVFSERVYRPGPSIPWPIPTTRSTASRGWRFTSLRAAAKGHQRG